MKRLLSIILAVAMVIGIILPSLPTLTYAAESTQSIVIDASEYPESEHNYGDNLNESKTFAWPDAESLTLTFSESTAVENSYDKIYLYDGEGN